MSESDAPAQERQVQLTHFNGNTVSVPCPLCNDLNLPERPYRDEKIVRHLIEDHDVGTLERANLLNCSRNTLRKWRKEFEINFSPYQYEIPEDEARELYHGPKNLSLGELADYYGCSYYNLRHRLIKYGIEIDSTGGSPGEDATLDYKQKDWLQDAYHKRGLSIKDISDECGVSQGTIPHWMDKYDIHRRTLSEAQHNRRDKEFAPHRDPRTIRYLYWDKKKTQRGIASFLGVSQLAVQLTMERHEIPVRHTGSEGEYYETTGGETVRSAGERTVADWLHHNDVQYVYEPNFEHDRMVPDFLVDGEYIEYWGMVAAEWYRERMAEKIDKYDQHNIDQIDLYPSDLFSLGDKLGQFT